MAYNAGVAFLQVVPSFAGIEKSIEKELRNLGRQIEQTVEQSLPKGFARASQDSIREASAAATTAAKEAADAATSEMRKSGRRLGTQAERQGDDVGGLFGRAFSGRLAAAVNDLPKFTIDADSTPAERAVAALRNHLDDLSKRNLGIDLTPDEIQNELRRAATDLQRIALFTDDKQIRAGVDAARRTLEGFWEQIKTDSERAAEQSAKAFEKMTSRAAQDTRRASSRRLAQFVAGVRQARTQLQKEADQAARIQRKADEDRLRAAWQAAHERTRAAYAEADAVAAAYDNFYRGVRRAEVRIAGERIKDAETRAKAEERAARDAGEALDNFYRGVRRAEAQVAGERIKQAEKVAAEQTRQAERAAVAQAKVYEKTTGGVLQRIARRAAESIGSVEIRADASDARNSIALIRAELDALSRLRPGIDVDTGYVILRLSELRDELRELNGQRVEIDVRADSGAALAELKAVEAVRERIDGKDVDIDVDTSGAGGALGRLADGIQLNLSRLGLLVSLGGSIGLAIVPAAAGAATAIGLIGASALAAGAAIGVMVLGFSGISDAVKAMINLEEEQNKSSASLARSRAQIASAADGVASAERNLANVRANNAEADRRAAQQVEAAELSLARAQLEARRAQQELTRAREQARRALEDMAIDVEDVALRQRQAALDVADAKKDLDAVLANPRATQEQREQAEITYEQALLQQERLSLQAGRLGMDYGAAAKAGIEGSEQVTQAQEHVRDTTQGVADAQRRLAEAVIAQTNQQRQAASALANAQQGVAAAQRSLEQAYISSGTAGGEALDNLHDAMARLSPQGQKFARFVFGLRDEFRRLREAASTGMLAGAQKAIEDMLPGFDRLSLFVARVSNKIGDLFVRFAGEMKRPTWRRFFDYIDKTAVPAMDRMFTVGANLTRGLVAILMAFTPFNDPLGEGLVALTERFALWAESLETSTGFQRFLDYARENGPKVVDLLKQLGVFAWRFIVAAAPIGTFMVEAFTKLFEWINKIPTDTLTVLIGAVAGIAGAFVVLAGVTAAINTGWAGLIIAGIAAVVTGFAFLYTKVEPFRDFLAAALRTIADTAVWLWREVLQPVLRDMGIGFQFLYSNFLVPFFAIWQTSLGAAGALVQSMWADEIQPVFNLIAWYIREILGPVVSWWWTNVIKPVSGFIGVAIQAVAAVFKVVAGLVQIAIKIMSQSFSNLYAMTVKPVIDLLRPLFSWLGEVWEKHIEPRWRKGMDALAQQWSRIIEMAKVPVRFMIEVIMNKGILAAYNKLAQLFDVEPKNVQIALPKGFAIGGPVLGPGTETSDSIIGRLSRGEHVWTAREVRAAGGHEAVIAMRRAVLNRTAPAWHNGGPVGGDGIGDLFKAAREKASDVISGVGDLFADPGGVLRELGQRLMKLLPGKDSAFGKVLLGVSRRALDTLVQRVQDMFAGSVEGAGVSAGGLGWQRMMEILRAVFPGLRLISGMRPGAVTVTGNRSYHAVGRAVDVPPRWDVFGWIRKHFPDSRELIFTPGGGLQIWNGRPHVYPDAAIKRQHYNHVHWAYDDGGYLPPGINIVPNFTGRPEPVLSPGQWHTIEEFVAQGMAAGGGDTYNFEFANTTLDQARLATIQQRADALNRANRPNR